MQGKGSKRIGYSYWQILDVIAGKHRAKHGYGDQDKWAGPSHSSTRTPPALQSLDQYIGELHQAKLIVEVEVSWVI